MIKKILFINPPSISLGWNVGLCYLAAVLKGKKNIEVKIIDLLNQPGNEDKRLLQAMDYDVVGISIKTLGIDEAIRIMRKVKKINNKAILTCGGVHISLDGYHFMKENKIFDIGFIKDSEKAIVDFMEGKKLEDIGGIIYRKNGKIIINKKGEDLDLDKLPYPDFNSFDIPLKVIGNYPLVTSRGCPYNCIYCTVQLVSKKWRPRKVENLIAELKKVKPRIKEFHIVDDNFTLRIDRVKEFCRRLIEEKLNLRWSCPNGIRADIIDEELVDLMKKSGCYHINLGIESLDEKVFNTINKGESLEDIKRAIEMLKKKKIGVFGNFIIGLPGSTFRVDMSSLKKSKEIGLEVCFWYPLSVYVGTVVYDMYCKDKNIKFIRDWKKGFRYDFKGKPILSFEKEDYKEDELIKMFFIANLRSNAYGILIDPKKSLVKRAIDLLKIILRYDPMYVFNHIFNAFKILMKYKKVY